MKKPSTKKKKASKLAIPLGYASEDAFLREGCFKKDDLLELGRDFVSWAALNEECAVNQLQYLSEKRICPSLWWRYRQKFPEFDDMVKMGLKFIGKNRDVSVFREKGAPNSSYILKTAPIYDPMYEDLLRLLANLDQDALKNIILNLGSYATGHKDDKHDGSVPTKGLPDTSD